MLQFTVCTCISVMTIFQDSDVVLRTCQSWITSVLSDVENQPFANVELVLRLVYMLGEVLTDKVCVCVC